MRLLYIKIPVHISQCLLRSISKGAGVQPPTSRLNSVGNQICRHHRSISQNPCHFSYFRQCGEWGVTCSRNQRKSDCLCHALEVKGLMPNSHLPSHSGLAFSVWIWRSPLCLHLHVYPTSVGTMARWLLESDSVYITLVLKFFPRF